MLIALLLAAQVVTSTAAPPVLRTELERALWSAYVTERTGRRVAERELAGARLELVARARRVERLETMTSTSWRWAGRDSELLRPDRARTPLRRHQRRGHVDHPGLGRGRASSSTS